MEEVDTVIIGGGHNGLICATLLAKAGHAVTLVEANEMLGGLASEREFHPGFKSTIAHTLYAIPKVIIDQLNLPAYGFVQEGSPLPLIALSETEPAIQISENDISGGDEQDQKAFRTYLEMLRKFSAALAPFWGKTMPRIGAASMKSIMTFGQLGLKLRMLGKADMLEFFRVATLPMRDLVDEHFSNETLKAALCWDGLIGSQLAPRSPNQAVLTLLNRMAGFRQGQHLIPKGGMGGFITALEAAAIDAGVTIRTRKQVAKITITADENGQRCSGIELSDGETIDCQQVVSSADPQTTFLRLVGAQHLEIEFTNRIRRIRNKGYVARLHLALSELPAFQGLGTPTGRMLIAPDMDTIEFAWDNAKYGELPETPVLELLIPTTQEHTLAPPGQHVLAINIMYVPHDLKMGWTPAAREQLMAKVMALLDSHAPGIAQLVLGSELLTPLDIGQQYHLTNGHWHHCEPAIDQLLMMRPTYEAAQYSTPIPGLFLCGAGSHPAGDISGNPGRNAAREILS
jgi:phytoene dehydrogenase-like protein